MTLKFKRTRLSPTKMRSGGSRLGENEPEMVFPDTDANDGKHGDAVDAVDAYDAYDAVDVYSSMANSGALGLAFTASVPVVGWREGGNPWRGGKEVIALMENGGPATCW